MQSIWHAIKRKFPPVLNIPLSINKGTFTIYKIKDCFGEVYDSFGEAGYFFYMEYLEDNQDSDEYALPAAVPLDAGENYSNDKFI